MSANPELEDFRKRTDALSRHKILRKFIRGDMVELGRLSLEDISDLDGEEQGRYFLQAAAELNRTSLKAAAKTPEAKIVQPRLRRAFAIKSTCRSAYPSLRQPRRP